MIETTNNKKKQSFKIFETILQHHYYQKKIQRNSINCV